MPLRVPGTWAGTEPTSCTSWKANPLAAARAPRQVRTTTSHTRIAPRARRKWDTVHQARFTSRFTKQNPSPASRTTCQAMQRTRPAGGGSSRGAPLSSPFGVRLSVRLGLPSAPPSAPSPSHLRQGRGCGTPLCRPTGVQHEYWESVGTGSPYGRSRGRSHWESARGAGEAVREIAREIARQSRDLRWRPVRKVEEGGGRWRSVRWRSTTSRR